VGIGIFVVFVLLAYWKLIAAGIQIYKVCWTCGVFANIYNAISSGAARIVPAMQKSALAVMSVGLALWIVYKTYQVFVGEKANELPKMEVDAGYFTEIYKRFLLAFAIAALFLWASPRFVLSNTVELALDFGTSVGRHVLRRSMIEHEFAHKIPDGSKPGEPNCRTQARERMYQPDEGQLLSNTTRDNLLCLNLEMDLLRQEYQELGWKFIENGVPVIWGTVLLNIGLRAGFYFGLKFLGRSLAKRAQGAANRAAQNLRRQGTATVRLTPKIANARRTATDAATALNRARTATHATPAARNQAIKQAQRALRNAKQAERNLSRQLENIQKRAEEAQRAADAAQKHLSTGRIPGSVKNQQAISRLLTDMGIPSLMGDASTWLMFYLNRDLRMALAGVIIVGGFIFINLLFAFIIIEQFLFLGAAIILFPFLAASYVFDETRSYATTALQNVLKFAIGLIVVCFVAAFCVELNLWIFGSMFGSGEDAITAGEALAMINADPENGLDDFIDTVDSGWYFLWALLAIMVNAKLLSEARTFAGWFGGDFQQSALGENLFTLGKSTAGYILSAHKKGVVYIARGAKAKKEDGKPTFIERIRALGSRRAEA